MIVLLSAIDKHTQWKKGSVSHLFFFVCTDLDYSFASKLFVLGDKKPDSLSRKPVAGTPTSDLTSSPAPDDKSRC